MILKGSQRGGAKQLGLHLLKTEENEHVELHDIRGFVSEDVVGALREAEAVSMGTKCKQFLFSVSLNPPETENVRIETFEQAIAAIEEKHGLADQPRVIIFHEKEGRRHCHAVWSRIDAETMTAKPLPFFKNKLMEVSKQLYLEHGWQMPKGFANAKDRYPRNFTLAEWQQAKRAGRHAGELKADIQEAWAISDTRQAFSHALEERGLYLARGDRRGHVAVTFEGEVISIARATGIKAKNLKSRIGDPNELRSVEDTRKRIGEDILPRIQSHLDEARSDADAEKEQLEERREEMVYAHALERTRLDLGQRARSEQEARNRAERFRKGMAGLWDRLTGQHSKLVKQNEMEALWALRRDQEQRQGVVEAQIKERQALQLEIRAMRERHAQALRELHFAAANYRMMKRGQEPKAKPSFERSRPPIPTRQTKPEPQPQPDAQRLASLDQNKERLDQLRAKSVDKQRNQDRQAERLRRLRENKDQKPQGPEIER